MRRGSRITKPKNEADYRQLLRTQSERGYILQRTIGDTLIFVKKEKDKPGA
ncbi:MAG: hypothetical protein AAF738_03955 [Bacteroidota bacterium]